MRLSTPAGVEEARAAAGLLRFWTLSTLPVVHAARSIAHAAADVARMKGPFLVVGSSWGSYQPPARLADGRHTGSEARAQLERDAARVREPVVVDGVERRRAARARAAAGLWIVALVTGPRLEVAGDQRDRPVALPADLADAVAEADFAELHVGVVLDRHGVRVQHVVQTAHAGVVRSTGAEIVAERMCGGNALAELVLFPVHEVAERPGAPDVEHADPLDRVHQHVRRELLEREVLGERVAEVRQRVADRLVRDRGV